MSLLGLSNELLTAITGLVHPSSIVNFSLTCQRIHGCAAGSLNLHRSRRRELRAQHDRHPLNIVKLLDKARNAPHELWYTRVLEFYGGRRTWEDWKTYFDYQRMKDEPKVNLVSSGPDLVSELDLEPLFQHEGLKSIMQDSMERIKKGDDEPLKTLLIASCPAIDKVTWVAFAENGSGEQPISILCDLISTCQPLPRSLWPPGLLSLHSISIGTCTEHVHPHDNLFPELADFCRLLLLPNLKSLRLNVAGFGDSDLEYLDAHVPARSSSVEEITFYICNFDKTAVVAILERLRALKVYRDIYLGGWTDILGDIQPWFGETLEELHLEGSNNYEMRVYSKNSALPGFTKLRIVTVYIGDLVQKGLTEKYLKAIGKGKHQVTWLDFEDVLPPALEIIEFEWPPRNSHQQLLEYGLQKTLFPEFFERLDKFVQRRGANNGGSLKKIFLGFMKRPERHVSGLTEMEAKEFLVLADTWTKSWAEAGVEVVAQGSREAIRDDPLECKPIPREGNLKMTRMMRRWMCDLNLYWTLGLAQSCPNRPVNHVKIHVHEAACIPNSVVTSITRINSVPYSVVILP